MSEWKTYRLSDVVQFNPAERLSKGAIAKKVAMEHLQPFTRAISGYELAVYSGGSKFRNGDTLMARITPCLENGKTAYVSILDNGEVGFGSTEYIVFRSIEGVTDSKFVYYFVTSPWFRNIAIKSMVGSSGRQRVQQSVLENLEINLPPLAEQKRIAGILGSLDDKIELNRRINANLEEQAQALFKSWFVDFEPFRDGPFVDSELGKIPQGWEVGTLSEIADITMGQSPQGSSYNEEGNGIIFYQGRTEFGNRFPSIRLYTTEPTRIAEINSVLLSVRAPVGDINIAKNKCCIGRGLAAIKSKQGYNSFILYLLQSLKPLLKQYNGEGTVFGCINRKEIEGLPIIIPKEFVINEFEEIAEKIDTEIKNLTTEQETLSALRDTLLPKLMSSELSVKNDYEL
jgi:restriction modification system DNA specificity domain protein